MILNERLLIQEPEIMRSQRELSFLLLWFEQILQLIISYIIQQLFFLGFDGIIGW